MSAATEIKAGDIVRIKQPESYLSEFARKIRDRDAVVEWVGTDEPGGYKGRAKVRFLKRGNRGKEFSEILRVNDLTLAEPPP